MTALAAPRQKRNAYPGIAGYYALWLPMLIEEARQRGYALAVHGSMSTDLDLIAVPWHDEADRAEDLVESLRDVVNGTVVHRDYADGFDRRWHNGVEKPHGRRAYTIYFDERGVGPYIDLSIMPRMSDVERNDERGM